MGKNKLSAGESQSEGSSVVVNHEPSRGRRAIAAIVYGLSVGFTVIFMIKIKAPLHIFKDFLEWLLVFLAITFVLWLIAFLLVFLFVKYRDRIHWDSKNKLDV